MTDRPHFHEAPALKRFSMHVRHGFFGRQGGASQGIYRSLNCGPGSKDNLINVSENRGRAVRALGGRPDKLVTVHQIHSAKAVIATEPYAPGAAPQADAIVTDRPGLMLGVLTADCAPVLIVDAHAGVIAAAHAGWRGAVGGVIEAAVGAMTTMGADPARMAAAVGPCLTQASFEVGPDLVDQVLDASPWADNLFVGGANPDKPDRQHFDLKAYCLGRLMRLGVSHADALADDTLTEADHYFSHRRSVRAGEPDYGRNISAIMLLG